jgi:hypothetical protein
MSRMLAVYDVPTGSTGPLNSKDVTRGIRSCQCDVSR